MNVEVTVHTLGLFPLLHSFVHMKINGSCMKTEKRKRELERNVQTQLTFSPLHTRSGLNCQIVGFRKLQKQSDAAWLRRCTLTPLSFQLILTFHDAYSQTNFHWFKLLQTNRHTMNLGLSGLPGGLRHKCPLCPVSNPALVLSSVGNSAAPTWITSHSQ